MKWKMTKKNERATTTELITKSFALERDKMRSRRQPEVHTEHTNDTFISDRTSNI